MILDRSKMLFDYRIIMSHDQFYNIGIKEDNKFKIHYRCPEDLEFFKRHTINQIVVMGKNTFDSIIEGTGEPLNNRVNVVLVNDDKDKEELLSKFKYNKKDNYVCLFISNEDIYSGVYDKDKEKFSLLERLDDIIVYYLNEIKLNYKPKSIYLIGGINTIKRLTETDIKDKLNFIYLTRVDVDYYYFYMEELSKPLINIDVKYLYNVLLKGKDLINVSIIKDKTKITKGINSIIFYTYG